MTEPAVDVLLVQRDEQGVQQTLDVLQKHHLASRIHVVREAGEALEFLFCTGAHAARTPGNPRVVVIDVDIATGEDGVEALRLIRQDPRTSRLFVTAVAPCRHARLAADDVFRAHELDVPVVMVGAGGEDGSEDADREPLRSDDGEQRRSTSGGRAVTDGPLTASGRRPVAPVKPEVCRERDFEALASLANAIAHEFNNIFAVVAAYTDLLLKDVDIDDPRHDGADEIFKAITRASALARQLMGLSANAANGPHVPLPARPRPGGGKRIGRPA